MSSIGALRRFAVAKTAIVVALRFGHTGGGSLADSGLSGLSWNYQARGALLGTKFILNSLPAPTQDERTMGLLAHLLQIFTGFMGPLVILLLRQNSRFVKFHALQSLIWQLCYMAVFLAGFAFAFFAVFAGVFHELSRPHSPPAPPIFFLLFPLLWLFAVGGWIANVILGVVYGMKANQGEWAAYPIIGKWCFPKSAPLSSNKPA